jgi:hypothetical protein
MVVVEVLIHPQLDLRRFEDKHLRFVSRQGERVVQPLEKAHFHNTHFVDRIAKSISYASIGNRSSIIPEFHGNQGTCEQKVEQLVVFDSIFADKPISIEDNRDEHVSWELIDLEQVEKDHEQLVQRFFNLSRRVSVEVLTVIVLNPRYAEFQQDLPCKGSIGAEPEGFHGMG